MTSPAPSGRALALHTLLSAVGEGSNLLLFLLGFLAARLLAPHSFGEYSTAFAFVGLFRILPDMGMSYASTLAISRDREQAGRLTGGLLGFQALLSALTVVLCLGAGAWLYDGVTWIAVVVLAADLVLKAVKSTLRWLLKALQLFGTEAVSLLVERTLILAAGLGALLAGGGVVGFVAAFAGVRLLETSGLTVYVHRRVLPLRPTREAALWADLFWKGLPFAYAGVMITLFFQVDAVLLEQMRGAREVGWYRAPVLVLEGLTLVPRVLGYALIPTMAALASRSGASVTALYGRGCRYLVLVGGPIGAFGVLEADRFIRFLFGADYGPSAAATRILIAAAPFMFLSNFGETTLACIDRWRAIVWISTGCLVLNVALNLLWIPGQGFLGAAWATLATEATYFLAGAVALHRSGHVISWPRATIVPLACLAVFAGVLHAARSLPLLAASLAASLAYALATVAFGVWDAKEKDIVRGLLRGVRPDAAALG